MISWCKTGLQPLLQPWGPWGLKGGGTNKIWWLDFHLTNKGGCSRLLNRCGVSKPLRRDSVRWQMERPNVDEKFWWLATWSSCSSGGTSAWGFGPSSSWSSSSFGWRSGSACDTGSGWTSGSVWPSECSSSQWCFSSECLLEWSCSKWGQWDCGTSTWGAEAVCWWSRWGSNCWAASSSSWKSCDGRWWYFEPSRPDWTWSSES